MSAGEEITVWLERFQGGDPQAPQRLWEAYYHRLVGLARQKLRDAPRRVADEEDVALSAFDSFCQGAQAGRFPRLQDRADLWRLLFVITARKAADLRQAQCRQRRGGGQVKGESAFDAPGQDGAGRGIEQVAGPEPTPEFAAEVAEQCRALLEVLPADLRQVAVWKMEGHTNEEIAGYLGRSVATVERKLNRVRKAWEKRRDT